MKLILTFALITFIKFTSCELTDNNAKPLPIYVYVSDHLEYSLLNSNKNEQIFRDKRQNDIQILRYETENSDNFMSFWYELSDGTKRQEALQFIDSQKDNQALVSGSSEYISKEGYVVQNSFTADDEGYVVKVLFGKNVKSVDQGIQQAAPPGDQGDEDLQYSPPSAEYPTQGPPTSVGVGNYDLLCSLGGGAGVCL